ncbi:DUF4249 domain-containing protein [Maribacter sp. 2307ULW6-5]|uniref:DUF4249 domain-containing protein n=1 Tax=Maribacter sp. 2307ULW6-5 TaxID=3386275 RepID=UPI0039BC502E
MLRNSYISILVISGLAGCIEPIDVGPAVNSTADSSGILVVEANLTDEQGTVQQVLLSRSRRIESDSTVNVQEDVLFNPNTPFISPRGLDVDPEQNAAVEVLTSAGNRIEFAESEPGIYKAPDTFFAERDTGYVLNITTADGARYASTEMRIIGSSRINDLYAERVTSDTGVDGMGIFVDTTDPTNETSYFRYAFEETYKIIAPNWTAFEFDIIREDIEFVLDENDNVIATLYPDVALKPREKEEQVCFKTDPSQDILVADVSGLDNNTVIRNQLRFIESNNPILSHRYSILVKQMAVSFESYQFYENLRNFSQGELVFSQVQPGPLEGNISSETLENKVIGFFDVSSVATQRLYFNYADFYPGEHLPPYFGGINCDRILAPQLLNADRDGPPRLDCPQSLIPRIKLELVEWLGANSDPPGVCEGPYRVTPRICGDCTLLGSNIVPEFWTEE